MAAKKETPKRKKTEGDFFDALLKKAGVELPTVNKVDEVAITHFFSTGSLALNALLSGSMWNGGMAGNKITALAGEESTGKTFIALQIVGNFLKEFPTGHVFIFDSEDDPSKSEEALLERGLDVDRVHVKRVNTIQDFRLMLIKLIDSYLAVEKEKRLPMFLVLDSLGNLSTLKEMHDTAKGALNKKGEDVRDMTRAPLIRGLFRVLTIKLGMADVPMLMTNHTYETMDPYGAKKQMGGGGGLRYCASTIVFLSKKKLRDTEKEVIGSTLTATLEKSRFTRYGLTVDLLLTHEAGMDTYWGLFDLGKEKGLIVTGTGKEKGNGISVGSYQFPDGQLGTKAEINANPAKYFDTEQNKAAFEELCYKSFRFGKGEAPMPELDIDEVPDEEFEEPEPADPDMVNDLEGSDEPEPVEEKPHVTAIKKSRKK